MGAFVHSHAITSMSEIPSTPVLKSATIHSRIVVIFDNGKPEVDPSALAISSNQSQGLRN
jgi:hypothetical protein